MLFVTNRLPKQSAKSKRNRKLTFDYQNTSVSQNLYFCRRVGTNDYIEITSKPFFEELKFLPNDAQLLFYIHGFNNNMEPDIFTNAETLQKHFNTQQPNLVKVIPIIWPCDDDSAVSFVGDYWDDQDAADLSGPGFARALLKFNHWRQEQEQIIHPCFRRMNVLAHSMGNRVLVNALQHFSHKLPQGAVPQLFRNIFMVAADVKNEILEEDKRGRTIVDACRNTLVYFANDDFAMPASKIANFKNMTASRRLGMTGPESLAKLPKTVYEIDCDEFNNRFDKKGHSYFLEDQSGNPSPIIKHMSDAIKTGRVYPQDRSIILK